MAKEKADITAKEKEAATEAKEKEDLMVKEKEEASLTEAVDTALTGSAAMGVVVAHLNTITTKESAIYTEPSLALHTEWWEIRTER